MTALAHAVRKAYQRLAEQHEAQQQPKRPAKLARAKLRRRQQHAMVHLWNKGDASFADIAAEVGVSCEDVERYLQAQAGWPGVIGPLRNCRYCTKQFRAARNEWYCTDDCRAQGMCRNWRDSKKRNHHKRKLEGAST